MDQRRAFVNIPETVSREAQEFLSHLPDPGSSPEFPEPDDLEGWKRLQEAVESQALAQSEAIVKRYSPTGTERGRAAGSSTCARSADARRS